MTAIVGGFITYAYLEPIFSEVKADAATVFLYIVAIDGALVGMSLGVLIPMFLPGICFGLSFVLMVECLGTIHMDYFFPIAGTVLSILSLVLSAR